MDFDSVSGRNSSALVAYYLRTTETGWYVSTDILKNDAFSTSLDQQVSNKATALTNKVEQLGASSKAVLLEDRLKHLKVRLPKPVGGDASAQRLVRTVHKAGLSLLLDRVDSRTGRIFQIQLPNHVAGHVDQIAKKVRDLFPSNVPMMVTIHTGDNNKNLHLQGWFCERAWDEKAQNWTKPLDQFRTKTGLSEFRAKVDTVLSECGATWKHDPDAPKRTVFHPAKSQFMKSLTHDELLKGEFLETIENPKLKLCLREEIEIARYHESKRQTKARHANTAAEFKLDIVESYEDVKTFVDGMKTKPEPVKPEPKDFGPSKEIASERNRSQEDLIRAELDQLTKKKGVTNVSRVRL